MLAVVLVIVLLPVLVALQPEPAPVIRGYVYDQNRQPVSGAYVKVVDSITAEVYGEGVTDANGYYQVVLNKSAVNRHVDIYWRKDDCSREEFGLLIPKEDYISRILYTYMTLEEVKGEKKRTITVFVYDYPYGGSVSNVTISVENARTLEWVAEGVTNDEGVATLEVPAGIEVNVYADVNDVRADVLGGQELGVSTLADTVVTIYVEVL